jgi:hypothetical protein
MLHKDQPATSIMKRTVTWLAVVMAMVTTGTVLDASPSFAAGGGDISVEATSSVGWAYFNADTMVLSIHDSHADGYGVVVPNYRSDLGDTKYYGWNRDGNGTTTYYYLHMPYGAEIEFQVCAEKGGLLIHDDCGNQVKGFAGPGI